jgi:antitoxin (DNA-binding transcriptional repressor) of toxin-antitoxin stability system
MKTLEMSEATGSLAEYAQRARYETLVVTEGGKPVTALVPIEEVDLESLSLGTNPDFLALIEQSRVRCHPGAGISTGEMRERLPAWKKPPRTRLSLGSLSLSDEVLADRDENR